MPTVKSDQRWEDHLHRWLHRTEKLLSSGNKMDGTSLAKQSEESGYGGTLFFAQYLGTSKCLPKWTMFFSKIE